MIRKARHKDREEMKQCNERNLVENYPISFWKEMVLKGQSFVLCNQDKIIGYILCQEDHIISFAIDKEYRNKGYGKKLLSQYENKPLILNVRPSNKIAIDLYSSIGLKIIEEIPDYYKSPIENCFVMKRENEII